MIEFKFLDLPYIDTKYGQNLINYFKQVKLKDKMNRSQKTLESQPSETPYHESSDEAEELMQAKEQFKRNCMRQYFREQI